MLDDTTHNESMILHTDMDKVYDIIENKGRYKYLVLIGATLAYLTHMFFLFSFPYFLIRPTAYCDRSGHWAECSHEEICNNIKNDVSYYFLESVEYNFVTEFGWYCDLTTSSFITGPAFFAGTTISVIIVTAISDTLGRMPLLITGVTGNIFAIVLFMIAASPTTCFISSFLVGFFTMANNSSTFNFLADSVPQKYRETFPSLMNTGWAIGEIVIAGVMALGVTWRTMCLIMVLFAGLFYIPLIWLRESPKFHFAQNKIYKAQVRLKNMAAINGSSIDDIHLTSPSIGTTGNEEQTFAKRIRMMCCDRHILVQIIIVTLLFSIGNMIFYAMSLNLENMGGNPYINGISLAIAEIAAYGLSGLSLRYFGPRISTALSFLATDIGVGGLVFFWNDSLWSIVFAFIGKLGSSAVDNLLYTMSGLIFPTEILGGALGIALLGTRAGNSSAKPLILLGPEIMCGFMFILGIIAIGLSFLVKVKKQEEKEEDIATISYSEGEDVI